MKTFLVPTDFSKNATHALDYAAALASEVNGKLIIVHIVRLIVLPVRSGNIVCLSEETEIDFNLELQKISSRLQLERKVTCTIETICQYENGPFQAGLNQVVQDKKVDLVVMGTKGATNLFDKLIGTNTFEFIKIAVCPVLAIPSSANYSGIKRIAYACDFESEETIFLQQLFSLAKPFGSEVSIINIHTDNELDIVVDEQIIRDITTRFSGNSYSISQIKEEDVVAGLNKFIEDNSMDLLAVSIKERSFSEKLFHSSTSKQLIYYTMLPLLALPEKPYQELLKGNNLK
ncbi:universal stress protein [Rufibacter sp. XAAS-G3-1]|uniref:universal stress protein n=1 Tax=Rufibacter sp. XAAS-G3-1 TaxID=2729134 RepID=UPI0015E6466B|nr:universal stress protein [Rufibacter sp. XAAS-G3-1]